MLKSHLIEDRWTILTR